jgi:hypothetical protein
MVGALISLLIYLLILGIIWWAVNAILGLLAPYIAEPFMGIIRVILIVILALILISVLLQLIGVGGGIGLHLPMLR